MKKLSFFFSALLFIGMANAQNVGIGTTTPQTKLHVFNGASGATPFAFSPLVVENNGHTYINLLSPAANETAILFGQPGSSANGVIMYNNSGTPNGFQFRNNGNLTRMVIDNAGNIGVGTVTPSAYGHGGNNRILEINNPNNGGDIQSHLMLSTNGTSGSIGGITWASQNVPGSEKRIGFIGDVYETGNAARMVFYTRNESANLGERFTIRGNGNVGIGTTNPNAPLGFPAALGKKITLYPGGTGDVGLAVQGNLLEMYADHPNADIAFGYDQGGVFTERMRVKGNGNIGLGVSDPALKLDISGRMRIRTGTDGDAGIWLNNFANTALQAFIGLENDNYVGFYGNVAGWKFGMNTQTGALKINGTEGAAGQVLTSNAAGAAPSWGFPVKTYQWELPFYTITNTETSIFNQNITATTNSSFIISIQLSMIGFNPTAGNAFLYIDGNKLADINTKVDGNFSEVGVISLPNFIFNVVPGTHSVELRILKNGASGETNLLSTYSGIVRSYISLIQIAR